MLHPRSSITLSSNIAAQQPIDMPPRFPLPSLPQAPPYSNSPSRLPSSWSPPLSNPHPTSSFFNCLHHAVCFLFPHDGACSLPLYSSPPDLLPVLLVLADASCHMSATSIDSVSSSDSKLRRKAHVCMLGTWPRLSTSRCPCGLSSSPCSGT